ncbi:MAG: MFS transporter [Planctomycetaceae bacterium]
MHGFHDSETPNTAAVPVSGPWYKSLNRYHWFVFVVSALGWLFDTMDQQLFTLARPLAMNELVAPVETPAPADETEAQKEARLKEDAKLTKTKRGAYGGYATSIFLIGWATGGLIFGVLGDKWGRVKTMLATIIVYSVFTGISAFSKGFWDFCLWRFLTGLGVGGEFAVGVALVAEVMPSNARPHALGLLQALSAVGNITAALIGMAGTNWKTMFLIGTAPALLSLFVRRRLKEPERWQAANPGDGAVKQSGSYAELFGDPELRYRALVGLLLASAGVIGLWGIGFFVGDLQREVFGPMLTAQGVTDVEGQLKKLSGITLLMQNIGAFFGIYMFSYLSQYLGRRPAFAICFIGAMFATINVYWNLGRINGTADIYWMVPLAGFFQLSLFGGYAIYFPELFPTRLRSTGTSFCYNVGRFVAAAGPFTLGYMIKRVYSQYEGALPFRYAGVTMCSIFLVGLIAVIFIPETKGKPLPE